MATREEDTFLCGLRSKLMHCGNLLLSGIEPTEVIRRLESVDKTVKDAALGGLIPTDVSEELHGKIQQFLAEAKRSLPGTGEDTAYKATLTKAGYEITREQLLVFISSDFKVKDMAESLGVSVRTIERRLQQFGLQIRNKYSDMSIADIDSHVKDVTISNKMIGTGSTQARLKGQGLALRRQQVRDSMKRVDPAGAAARALALTPIRRRLYSVSGPNALWHIDGHHKLIRWKIVIHGAIDGFSRSIVFLRASDNNRASTVKDLFVEATEKFGIPSRVRTDHGGENAQVAFIMENEHGQNRGSSIQGASVHNQRIERLWVDVIKDVVNSYRSLFTAMETSVDNNGIGILDMDSDVHLWLLHYIFLPRLNRNLDEFVAQKNNQGLRTENMKTPSQLFMQGMLKGHSSASTAPRDFWSQRMLELAAHMDPRTEVAAIPRPLTDAEFQLLEDEVHPLSGPRTDQQCIQLFLDALGHVRE